VLCRNSFCGLVLVCFSGTASALEVGFESIVTVDASDNVFAANAGEEVEGQVGFAQFGVFGEQRGTRVQGGFSGEIYSQRQLDDPDANFSAITQFIGAAEFQITPRALSWYVGDILGEVRVDDGIQSIEEAPLTTRNIFATGPQFVYEIDSFSRINTRFMYITQSQDDIELETLYNTDGSWEIDTARGNTWGTSISNIFTDNPEENLEGDFNRFSLAATWRRSRGLNSYSAQLGGTRYDTEDESLNGVNARFSFERQLSPQSIVALQFTRDLSDQALTTIDSLLDNGTGLQGETNGFSDDTRVNLSYAVTKTNFSYSFGVGVGQSNFRLISNDISFIDSGDGEDRRSMNAVATYQRAFTPYTSIETALTYEQQDFINRPDTAQSVLGEARAIRRLSRSFEAILGYRFTLADGQQTRLNGFNEAGTETIDSIENRVSVSLRWAPPSRVTQDLTIQLKSLLR